MAPRPIRPALAPIKFFDFHFDEMRPTFGLFAILLAVPAAAQQPSADLTVDAITHGALAGATLPEPHWLDDGSAAATKSSA